MNSSAGLLPPSPQTRGELYLKATNLRLRSRFDEALGGCSSFIPVTVACTRNVATVTPL